jgi:hypothetical protein
MNGFLIKIRICPNRYHDLAGEPPVLLYPKNKMKTLPSYGIREIQLRQ